MTFGDKTVKELADLAETNEQIVLVMIHDGKVVFSTVDKDGMPAVSELVCSGMLEQLDNLKPNINQKEN